MTLGQGLLCLGDACILCLLYAAMLCTCLICCSRYEATPVKQVGPGPEAEMLQASSGTIGRSTSRRASARPVQQSTIPKLSRKPAVPFCVFDRYPRPSRHRVPVRSDCRSLLQQASSRASAGGLLGGDARAAQSRMQGRWESS